MSFKKSLVASLVSFSFCFSPNFSFANNEKLPLKVSLPKPVRREGKFSELYHDSNASINKSWVHQETRLNQIFYNNYMSNKYL